MLICVTINSIRGIKLYIIDLCSLLAAVYTKPSRLLRRFITVMLGLDLVFGRIIGLECLQHYHSFYFGGQFFLFFDQFISWFLYLVKLVKMGEKNWSFAYRSIFNLHSFTL